MRSNKELAKLMKKGLKMEDVYEERRFFIYRQHGVCCVCALGAAIVGLYEDIDNAYQAVQQETDGLDGFRENRINAASKLLDINPELAEYIDGEHFNGTPISKIILFLEAKDKFRKAEGL